MKPDLTYYHQLFVPPEKFLYFPEKKTLVNFATPRQKKQKNICIFFQKKFLVFWDGC